MDFRVFPWIVVYYSLRSDIWWSYFFGPMFVYTAHEVFTVYMDECSVVGKISLNIFYKVGRDF